VHAAIVLLVLILTYIGMAAGRIAWLQVDRTGIALLAVIADPAEGEALTGVGTDLVESVPMPASIRAEMEAFVAEHHVQQPHYRRQIDRTGLTARPTDSESENQA